MPLEDIIQVRKDKLARIIRDGESPYPAKSWRTHIISDVINSFIELETSKEHVILTGRLLSKREHGALIFLDLRDESGQIQLLLKKDDVGDEIFNKFTEAIDIGDIIEVKGFVFNTKRNEKTLQIVQYRILTKSILPLPEKWHGIVDVEDRYRKRYLDLIFNEDVRNKFYKRAHIIQSMRSFLISHKFLEVTTPTLQPLYGGASARPFKTHLNSLDMTMFLRLAPELYLKRLMVGGFERVFEFATCFRNEGIDREHSPEFLMLEFYAAYTDIEWGMDFIETMLAYVARDCFGSFDIQIGDNAVSFKPRFSRIRFDDLLKQATGLDYVNSTIEDFVRVGNEKKVPLGELVDKANMADELIKKLVRPTIIQPLFVTHYPTDMLPLAKKSRDPMFTESFQLLFGGFEVVKAFGELNDPMDQRERFAQQEDKRAKGDEEAQQSDENFLEALEYGMPPACGAGIGIDRLVTLLTNSHSLREIQLFPLMRKDN